MTTITNIEHLLAIATERRDRLDVADGCVDAADPMIFLISLFRHITRNRIPITREGTERLLDTLFENPAFAPLLSDPTIHQSQLASAIDLPSTSPAFQAFWTHIILPAWGQHATIHQVMKESLNP